MDIVGGKDIMYLMLLWWRANLLHVPCGFFDLLLLLRRLLLLPLCERVGGRWG
jgi:hypothetical protein